MSNAVIKTFDVITLTIIRGNRVPLGGSEGGGGGGVQLETDYIVVTYLGLIKCAITIKCTVLEVVIPVGDITRFQLMLTYIQVIFLQIKFCLNQMKINSRIKENWLYIGYIEWNVV